MTPPKSPGGRQTCASGTHDCAMITAMNAGLVQRQTAMETTIAVNDHLLLRAWEIQLWVASSADQIPAPCAHLAHSLSRARRNELPSVGDKVNNFVSKQFKGRFPELGTVRPVMSGVPARART